MKRIFFLCATLSFFNPLLPITRWNWQTIATDNVSFPKDFLWGAATSAHQVEGNCTNNSCYKAEESGRFHHKAGIACDHWNRYKEDVQLLKKAGLNSYRFSVEWSKIEPREGEFDETALAHYQNVVDELVRNGIKPCITLHHYTDPIWFVDKGGFEKIENIAYFTHFAQTTIDRLQPHGVHLWFTFNAPDGYAAKGYRQRTSPPFKEDIQLMAEVYKNMLEAHVRIYRSIKPRYQNTIQIGIVKNLLQLDPYYSLNPFDSLACTIGTNLIDTGFYHFFTKGRFSIWIPFKVNCKHLNHNAIGAMDFIGMTYYSHMYIKNFQPTHGKDEEVTQSGDYVVYPEGLYRALTTLNKKIAKPLAIPIYITENGIATDDEEQRERFLKRHLFVVSKALHDEIPVKGYMYWSLFDNYEWGTYNKHYGIYAVNRETQERTYKKGAAYLTWCALSAPTF